MKKVTLAFPNLYVLWKFRTSISANVLDINVSQFSLTCDCNDEEVQRAVNEFGARILTATEN